MRMKRLRQSTCCPAHRSAILRPALQRETEPEMTPVPRPTEATAARPSSTSDEARAVPAAAAQRRLWVMDQFEPGTMTMELARAAGPYRAGAQTIALPAYRRYVEEFTALAAAIRASSPLAVSFEEELRVHEALLRACAMT